MPPNIHKAETRQDNKTILYQGQRLENQHTRKTLGTLSWVYKPSNHPVENGPSSPCWSYQSQDLHPAKTVGVEMHIPLPMNDSFNDYVGQAGRLRVCDHYFLNTRS